ncbi:MAG: hypothetical protein JWP39_3949 [Jatrophihabitans sp.]|nr:hypothetical protein [Jatrophihabitans sp.]
MTQPYDPLQKQQQPAPGGYPAAPPPQGGYPAPPQGGYPAPPPQGGYPAPPQHGGYPAAPGLPPLPPGTELATAGKRIGTYLLEIVLAIVTLGIGYIVWTLIVWARGQTPGKQVMKMRIYHLQNQRAATWGQMFLRQFVGGIVNGILYIGFIVSVVFLFTDPLRRTVPDRIAGTIVLSDPNKVLAPK